MRRLILVSPILFAFAYIPICMQESVPVPIPDLQIPSGKYAPLQQILKSAIAQTPIKDGPITSLPKEQGAVEPSIVWSGPTSKNAMRSVILKVKFTGQDLKVDCTPKNDWWTLVRFFDDSIGVIFDPDIEGLYTFVAACNAGGKTAIGMHQIQIGTSPTPPIPIPPGPNPPVPTPLDDLTKKLQAAYTTDLAAGVGKVEFRQKLVATYKQGMTDFIPIAKTNSELASLQKKLNEASIGVGTMPGVRAIIAAEVLGTLGKDANTPLDKAKALILWQKFSDSLNKLTP